MFGLFRRNAVKMPSQKTALQDAVTVPSKETRKLTVRIPVFQLEAMRKECKAKGISLNEATVMLYSYILNRRYEFVIMKKIKENRE